MSESTATPLPPQIAVLGSSGDIATEEELTLAAAAGQELARRRIVCVTGGDDGVMGAAARAAKAGGGTTIAVIARDRSIDDGSCFDACVNTGLAWVQFSDALLRSCVGAIVIGGGAGTMGELSVFYLAERPLAFCGSRGHLATMFADRPLDQRELMRFPAFEDAGAAIDHVVEAAAGTRDSGESLAAGAELHFASYPFGVEALYRQAAAHFRRAVSLSRDEGAILSALASLEDALADVEYYDRQDYLCAASHYSRALSYARRTDNISFSAYLEAILLESVASALHEQGMHAVGAAVAKESANRYQAAIAVSPENEHKYLRHSAEGLVGDAALFEAHHHFRSGQVEAAREAIGRARAAYSDALSHHPPYGENVSSSSYQRVIDQVEQLEAKLPDHFPAGHDAEQP